MSKEIFFREYLKLLQCYFCTQEERALFEAADLGRYLVKEDVPLEEIAEMHEVSIRKLAEEAPDKTLLESVQLISAPLMELLMSYGLALREMLAAREKAEARNIRLATAIEQAGESILITNRAGIIEYVNPALERISGYSRNEVIGRNPCIFKSGEQGDNFYAHMWRIITQGRIWHGRMVNRRKSGEFYHLDCTISPVKDPEGRIVNYVSVRRDVTREIELGNHLRQAQKMEAIGTLAGGIAHDFNNILSSVIGFTELVLDGVDRSSRQYEYLKEVQYAGKRATELVKQILTFSRQSSQELKPVQIDLIVREALKLLRASLPSFIEIRENIGTDLGIVLADPTQIHQVVMNLCTNAHHAMLDRNGILEVTLEKAFFDAENSPETLDVKPGNYLCLTVADTGAGIPPEIRERIFDPYFTTKDKDKGTGLGLSVVRGIVNGLGGQITVDSIPGKGTIFTVFLPIMESSADQKKVVSMQPALTGNERILIVDDEEPIVRLLQHALEHLGYRVTSRTSSVETLEAFRAAPEDFDLVVTDMTMPNMTGDLLAMEIKKIRTDMAVILCTGFSEKITRERAAIMGIDAFLMKPVDRNSLAREVRKVLDQHTEKQGDNDF